MTGNLYTNANKPKQTLLWLTTTSGCLKLVLVIFKPYMQIKVSLHITLNECYTITIDPCRQVEGKHKTEGYSHVVSKTIRQMTQKQLFIDCNLYLRKYKSLCTEYFPEINQLRIDENHFSGVLEVQEGNCVSLNVLSVANPVTNLFYEDIDRYTFRRVYCAYSLVISAKKSPKLYKVTVLAHPISTNLGHKAHVTVFSEDETSDTLIPERVTMISGGKLHITYAVSGVFTYLPSVFTAILQQDNTVESVSGHHFDLNKLLIMTDEIQQILKALLSTYLEMPKLLLIPTKRVEFEVTPEICPGVAVTLKIISWDIRRWLVYLVDECTPEVSSKCGYETQLTLVSKFTVSPGSVKFIYAGPGLTILTNKTIKAFPHVVTIHPTVDSDGQDKRGKKNKCSLQIKVQDTDTYLFHSHHRRSLSFGDHFYWKSYVGSWDPRTWTGASKSCEKQNSTLLTIADPEEEKFVVSVLVNINTETTLIQPTLEINPAIFLGLVSVELVNRCVAVSPSIQNKFMPWIGISQTFLEVFQILVDSLVLLGGLCLLLTWFSIEIRQAKALQSAFNKKRKSHEGSEVKIMMKDHF